MIDEEDDRLPRGQQVAVLSHAFWQRRFGGDPGVVGRGMTLERFPFTIVGVAPAGFFGESVGEAPDLDPLAAQPTAPAWLWRGHSVTWLGLMGRLAPGVSLEQALAGHAGVSERIQAERAAAMKKTEFRADVAATHLLFEPASRGFSRLRGAFGAPACDPDGGGRARAARGLRECRDASAGARGRPRGRDRRPSRSRRHARPDRTPDADRKPVDGARRRRAGVPCGRPAPDAAEAPALHRTRRLDRAGQTPPDSGFSPSPRPSRSRPS